jgi:hypothetical protein
VVCAPDLCQTSTHVLTELDSPRLLWSSYAASLQFIGKLDIRFDYKHSSLEDASHFLYTNSALLDFHLDERGILHPVRIPCQLNCPDPAKITSSPIYFLSHLSFHSWLTHRAHVCCLSRIIFISLAPLIIKSMPWLISFRFTSVTAIQHKGAILFKSLYYLLPWLSVKVQRDSLLMAASLVDSVV